MGAPPRQRTARESPQLATTMCVGPTTATTAVDPALSHLGAALRSHRRAAASESIRAKLRCSAAVNAGGDEGQGSCFSNSSATNSCIRSLHKSATC